MATQLVPTILGTIHDITELANGSLHWTIETRGWIVCCAAIKLILVFVRKWRFWIAMHAITH